MNAARLYKESADQGYARAQANLGLCFENGIGVKVDEALAIDYYRLAAQQNDFDGLCSLGYCFYVGNSAVAKDHRMASQLFLLAANENATAQHNTAVCYLNGDGMVKYRKMARQYFIMGAANGNDQSKQQLAKFT